MKQWTVQHQIVTVELFIKNSQLQLQSVVSDCSHKVMMLLATILFCYCGSQNGVEKDQCRTLNHTDVHFQLIHLTMWSR